MCIIIIINNKYILVSQTNLIQYMKNNSCALLNRLHDFLFCFRRIRLQNFFLGTRRDHTHNDIHNSIHKQRSTQRHKIIKSNIEYVITDTSELDKAVFENHGVKIENDVQHLV